ncbi:MAG: ATP-binding cassette domain-containing protein, partial [Candidatus Poribacteria bacterium]|nr:ATP-binding cassette domain-containing protein [Candidatus Poribacteria bacterium]
MIQLHQVSFSYGELSVLEKVSLRVERGEFVFLVGPSGSGKTTLL